MNMNMSTKTKMFDLIRRKGKLIALTVLTIGTLLCSVLPVLNVSAAPSQPNFISVINTPTAVQPAVFENIYTKGDMLFVFSYDVDYTGLTAPTDACSTLYYGQILGTNNSTVITSTPNPLLYYGYGLSAFYFNPADVTSYGLSWGTPYYIQINGINTFSPVPTSEYQLVAGSYNASATLTQGDTQLQQYLMNSVMLYLQSQNGTQYLSQNTAGNYVLNSAGGQMVNSVIPYLDTIIPTMYQTSASQINPIVLTPNGSAQTNLTLDNQLGPTLAGSFTGLGSIFGISEQETAMGWILICVCLVIGIVFAGTGNLVGAGICAIPMVFIGVWMGAIPVAALFTGTFVLVVLLAFYLFIRGM